MGGKSLEFLLAAIVLTFTKINHRLKIHVHLSEKSEINKFSPKNMKLKVIVIYDFKKLQNYSVKDLRNADVVIVPIDILETKGYFENLTRIAKLENMKPYPGIPTHSGQKELNGARGVWIP